MVHINLFTFPLKSLHLPCLFEYFLLSLVTQKVNNDGPRRGTISGGGGLGTQQGHDVLTQCLSSKSRGVSGSPSEDFQQSLS